MASIDNVQAVRMAMRLDLNWALNAANAPISNRKVAEFFLEDCKVDMAMANDILYVYDIGFNFYCDGKSTPFRRFRVPGFMKPYGLKRCPVSVRHDWDYYSGTPQDEADLDYYHGQLAIGLHPIIAKLEYWGLRVFGGFAWRKHQRERYAGDGYGTIEWCIANMPRVRM